MDPVLAAIDQALARTGLTDAAASKLAVGNYSLLKNMRADRGEDKRYSFQSLQALARVLGLECYFGPKRELSGFSETGETSELSRADGIRNGYLPIPWHQEASRRGSAPVAFQASWLASEGFSPDALTAVVPTKVGFSLSEAKNTVAILETAALQKGAGALWCYRDGTELGICRAAFSSEVIVLLPGAEDGDAKIIDRRSPGVFKMLGRVVWLGLLPKL